MIGTFVNTHLTFSVIISIDYPLLSQQAISKTERRKSIMNINKYN